MFGVTPEGFVTKPLATILDEINDSQRGSIDPLLDLDARSAQGQINQITSAALAELWEVGQASYGAAYPDSANDASLDNVSSITGTTRSPNTKTLVEGVLVTLAPNKALPAGSVANLTGQPNARFVSLVEVPADISGGTFPVDFEAEEAGATSVAIGQLDEIAEPVDGWVSVTNPAIGLTGEETETDAELRVRRIAELEGGGSTNVNSIRSELLQDVPGVVDAVVFENDLDVVVDGMRPHSVRCVLRGGITADIAQSIFDTKAGGINTNGLVVTEVLDSQGVGHTIRHDIATELVYHLIAVVEVDPQLFDDVGGIDAIKAAIKLYIDALGIGGDVVVQQVQCAILEIPGTLKVSTFLHGFAPAPTDPDDLVVDDDQFTTSDAANLDITTTP